MADGRGGGARISFSLGARSSDRRPQARTALFDEEEEEDRPRDIPLSVKRPRTEREPPRPSKPVIPMQAHTDWREERKRRLGIKDRHAAQLGSLASMRRADAPGGAPTRPSPAAHDNAPERAFTEPQQEGLVVRKTEHAQREDTPPADEAGASPSPEPRDETEESAAVRELLAGAQGGPRNDRVIAQPSEEDVFRSDVDTRPEAPTLDEYSSMPVEEFGAAMLRGMGWKDGSGVGKSRSGPTRAPEVHRRAALLGIGAKERTLPSSRQDRRRDDRKYMPVVRRDDRQESSRSRARDDDRREYGRSYRSERDDRRDRRRDDRRDYERSSREDRAYRDSRDRYRDDARHGSTRDYRRSDSYR